LRQPRKRATGARSSPWPASGSLHQSYTRSVIGLAKRIANAAVVARNGGHEMAASACAICSRAGFGGGESGIGAPPDISPSISRSYPAGERDAGTPGATPAVTLASADMPSPGLLMAENHR